MSGSRSSQLSFHSEKWRGWPQVNRLKKNTQAKDLSPSPHLLCVKLSFSSFYMRRVMHFLWRLFYHLNDREKPYFKEKIP